jgi:hypothetical protein
MSFGKKEQLIPARIMGAEISPLFWGQYRTLPDDVMFGINEERAE